MSLPTKSALQPQVLHVRDSDEVGQIHQQMKSQNSSAALVLNTQDEVVGVITERMCEVSSPSSKAPSAMRSAFEVIGSQSDLASICKSMVAEKISAYLLQEDTQITAVITAEEILTALYKTLFERNPERRSQLEILFFSSLIGQFPGLKRQFEN